MTRQLFILRHAKSSWDDPGLEDHDRPLAPRGYRAARVMADHLRQQRIEPDLVLCSSALRTRQTLEELEPAFGPDVEISIEAQLYGASKQDLLQRLNAVRPEVGSVLVIGHNPSVHGLATMLAGSGTQLGRLEEKFPTAALCVLSFEGGWDGLAAQGADLVSLVRPKELDSAAH